MKRIGLAFGSLATLIAFLSIPPQGAEATFPGTNGKIAFENIASDQVLTVNPDGSGLRRLAYGGTPSWSADGSLIVYEGNVNDASLWVMNADGTDQHVVVAGANSQFPVFAPDGTKILFLRNARPGGLWVVNVDGSGLTQISSGNGLENRADWSPDGSSIVFSRSGRIVLMHPDGTHQQPITAGPYDYDPSWAPDGSQIAFGRDDFGAGRNDIWVMNADGSNQVNITAGLSRPSYSRPAWSPDGTMLVVHSEGGGLANLTLIASDGSWELNISRSGPVDYPTWQPLP